MSKSTTAQRKVIPAEDNTESKKVLEPGKVKTKPRSNVKKGLHMPRSGEKRRENQKKMCPVKREHKTEAILKESMVEDKSTTKEPVSEELATDDTPAASKAVAEASVSNEPPAEDVTKVMGNLSLENLQGASQHSRFKAQPPSTVERQNEEVFPFESPFGLFEVAEEKLVIIHHLFHVSGSDIGDLLGSANGKTKPLLLKGGYADDMTYDGPLADVELENRPEGVFFSVTPYKRKLPTHTTYPRDGIRGEDYQRVIISLEELNFQDRIFYLVQSSRPRSTKAEQVLLIAVEEDSRADAWCKEHSTAPEIKKDKEGKEKDYSLKLHDHMKRNPYLWHNDGKWKTPGYKSGNRSPFINIFIPGKELLFRKFSVDIVPYHSSH